MTKGRDRVVCIPLSEDEWAALVAKHPDPVEWLRAQVRAEVESAGSLPEPSHPKHELPTRPWSTRRV